MPTNSDEFPAALNETTLRKIAYLSGLGGLALSVIYLAGFWESFGLNVLEFIGFSDVLAYALFPILALISFQAIPYLYGRVAAASRPQAPPPDALVQFGRKYWWLLTSLCVVGILVNSRLASEPERTVVSMTFLYIILFILVDRAVLVGELSAELRPLVLFATLLVFYVFVTGRISAYQIIDGEAELVVDRKASNLPLGPGDDSPLSYVGHLSAFYILYESKGTRIIILRTDAVGPLVLLKNPKLQAAATATAPTATKPSATTPSPLFTVKAPARD